MEALPKPDLTSLPFLSSEELGHGAKCKGTGEGFWFKSPEDEVSIRGHFHGLEYPSPHCRLNEELSFWHPSSIQTLKTDRFRSQNVFSAIPLTSSVPKSTFKAPQTSVGKA